MTPYDQLAVSDNTSSGGVGASRVASSVLPRDPATMNEQRTKKESPEATAAKMAQLVANYYKTPYEIQQDFAREFAKMLRCRDGIDNEDNL